MNAGVGRRRIFNLVKTAHNAMLVFIFHFILNPTYSNRTCNCSPISNPRWSELLLCLFWKLMYSIHIRLLPCIRVLLDMIEILNLFKFYLVSFQ
jgi:hypothetical protein